MKNILAKQMLIFTASIFAADLYAGSSTSKCTNYERAHYKDELMQSNIDPNRALKDIISKNPKNVINARKCVCALFHRDMREYLTFAIKNESRDIIELILNNMPLYEDLSIEDEEIDNKGKKMVLLSFEYMLKHEDKFKNPEAIVELLFLRGYKRIPSNCFTTNNSVVCEKLLQLKKEDEKELEKQQAEYKKELEKKQKDANDRYEKFVKGYWYQKE